MSLISTKEPYQTRFGVMIYLGLRKRIKYILKWNYSNAGAVWIKKIIIPFDIPDGANPKYTSTLLDKSIDVWKYKVNMVYYDGTKKEFTFTVNINTGEYKASI